MARAAIGLGDDLLSATIMAGAKRDPLGAPAMNPGDVGSPATEAQRRDAEGWGHRFVGPAEG
jgi:phosphopantothenoylcysteine decarboxylase/phosphopantothenate--cysteine ligase